MPSSIENIGLSSAEFKQLKALLKSKRFSEPIVLRDHRKRGPLYWSLIFDAAKNAPRLFGLSPLKMVNFKGVYLVDSQDYNKKLSQIALKLRRCSALKEFSKGREKADAALKRLTAEFKSISFPCLSNAQLHSAIKRFYGARYPYTQYSFFFDTVTKSVKQTLTKIFNSTGADVADIWLAYVPDEDTIEFDYLGMKEKFLGKHRAELKRTGLEASKCSKRLQHDLQEFMGAFADFAFVDFSMPLENKGGFLKKVWRKGPLDAKVSRVKALRGKKERLLDEVLAEAAEKGFKPDFVEELFLFAGNLSAWESKARQTWTRLHRAAKPLIEEIGARAAKQNLINNTQGIYNKEIKEIIAIAEKLSKVN